MIHTHHLGHIPVSGRNPAILHSSSRLSLSLSRYFLLSEITTTMLPVTFACNVHVYVRLSSHLHTCTSSQILQLYMCMGVVALLIKKYIFNGVKLIVIALRQTGIQIGKMSGQFLLFTLPRLALCHNILL